MAGVSGNPDAATGVMLFPHLIMLLSFNTTVDWQEEVRRGNGVTLRPVTTSELLILSVRQSLRMELILAACICDLILPVSRSHYHRRGFEM